MKCDGCGKFAGTSPCAKCAAGVPTKRPLQDRLIEGSARDNTSGCLRWQGAKNPKGYGEITVDNRRRAVHRIAHEVWIGPILEGFEIDHVAANGCVHRDCIEPSHLEAVTHLENLARKPVRTHCKNGHEYTPENIRWSAPPAGRENGSRICRACRRGRRAAARAAKKAESELGVAS